MSAGSAAWLNGASEETATALLAGVCASRAWGLAVLAGRPFPDLPALLAASDRATAALAVADLDEAVAGHPPIGRPRSGASAREQSGVDERHRAAFAELGARYQDRFGQTFLVCASGRSGEELLAVLRERLDNPPEREREITRTELGRINRLRLARLAEEQEGSRG